MTHFMKKDLRQYYLKKLANFPGANRATELIESNLKALLVRLPKISTLGLYSPLSNEPRLDFRKFTRDYTLALPRITNNHINYYIIDNTAQFIKNNYGIFEPHSNNVIIPEVIIVPGLANDLGGGRLGRGKGFFDRFLARARNQSPQICVIGVCFNIQITKILPLELHDQKVDYIITEQQIIKTP
jgi:5-formyltetrahydrofolate cyclo-ligase